MIQCKCREKCECTKMVPLETFWIRTLCDLGKGWDLSHHVAEFS